MTVSVANPELWWCQGHGDQVLYTFQAEAVDASGAVTDCVTKRSGFRRVKLVENEKYKIPETFPKTQEYVPITIELNGRRIFAKGSNFVPPEIFPGIIDEDTYYPLVKKATECHMNLFRIWGGGGPQKDSFYSLCDEMGIMVWQEFPLACNDYPDDPHYLQILDQESTSIIRALRTHPSIVMWCGGNELFNDWSCMTNQRAALRLLNKKCYELDPLTPFIATSPLYGMGHGHYVFRNVDGSEVIEDYITTKATAYTEFGCPGPAPVDYIKKMMTPEEYADMSCRGSWKSHHAFSAWIYEDTWLRIGDIKYYYGTKQTQEEILEHGAELQAQYYKHVFEEARRQWPYCSMVANWCYNEPWPCAANNSLLSWPAIEKKAYYAVKESLRDECFSLRVHKLGVQKGELIPIDFYVLNHGMSVIPASDYEIGMILDEQTDILLSQGRVESTEAMTVKRIIGLSAEIKDWNSSKVKLYVRSKENPALNSEYILYLLHEDDLTASKRYY